ncbi:MAG: translocation/assembly module TamB domain-containing protein [Cyclobacteriaceae bacterium]|nr:translocation/assembly module TamB domain-containing protein [Cyclobacteriaceae bacterium]
MEKKAKVTDFLHKTFRVLIWVVFYFLVLILLIGTLVQFTPVQNWLVDRVTSYLNNRTNFTASIDQIQITWWDALTIQNLEIRDTHDSLMIGAKEAFVDFELSSLLAKGNPTIDQVRIEQAKVQLITHKGDSIMNINQWVNELSEAFGSGQSSGGGKFSITNIDFRNSEFALINSNSEPITEGLDYNRMRFSSVQLSASNFLTQGGRVELDVGHLSGKELASGLEIKEFKTNFTFAPTYMEFDQLRLVSNESHIQNFLKFEYESPTSLSNFVTDVKITARMEETILGLGDLNFFAPSLPNIEDQIILSGEVIGSISDIKSDEFLLRIGQKTEIFGAFYLDGLPEISETYINLSLKNSTIQTRDLSPYLGADLAKQVNKLGTIRLNADFAGLLNRFTTNGDFKTSIGSLTGRVNYDKKGESNSIVSKVEIDNLDLGVLTDRPDLLQKVSLSGNVDLQGSNAENLLLDLNASISELGLLGYDYKNIQTDAKYGLELFEGNLSIQDPNLALNGSGSINLKESFESINIRLQLDSANLQALNLMDTSAFVHGYLEMDTRGIEIDKLTGIMRYKDIMLGYEDRVLDLGDFSFQSLFAGGTRTMSLNSDYIVAGASGQFNLNQMSKDLPLLLDQYLAILTQEEPPIANLDQNFNLPYNLDLNVRFIDINPILKLVQPELYVSKNTLIEGAFYQTEENTIFNFFTSIDTIRFQGNEARDVNIDFNTSKFINGPEILASFYVFSKQQNLGGKLDFSNLGFEAIWNNEALDLNFALDQDSTQSHARINAVAQFSSEETKIQMLKSQLEVLSNNWEFDPNNQIRILPNAVAFENLRLYSGNQEIKAEGILGKSVEKKWTLSLKDVNANILNTFAPQEYEGAINGLVTAYFGNDDQLILNSQITINGLAINEIPVGDLITQANLDDNALDLKIENVLKGKKTIDLSGTLGLSNLDFDLKGELEDAELAIFEPFLSNYLSDMGGSISGNIQLQGDPIKPILQGEGKINQGKVRVNFLNTLYQLDGSILFTPGEIRFDRLVAKDVRGNTANLNGGLTYQGIRDILLDIHANLNNFQVMNTSAKDNEVFYGNVYVTGGLDITGTTSNLVIDARATSQPDTRIFIPLSSSDEQVSEDYIHFINIYDTVSVQGLSDEINRLDIQNVQMNFVLDVTPDAYAEIVIDPRTQEKISGRGRGVLTMNIDTQGNFSLNGTYEVTEATYNFSLYNVVKKEFSVDPGGRISWYGDPYQGIMDLTARYEESVSIQPLLATSNTSSQENTVANRRYPVSVIMNLDGELLSPDIEFGFDFSQFPNTGDLQTAISSFQSRVANDEQEMNRQVFSVIMTRSFSPEGQFAGVNSLSNSLGQLLSAQLNSFLGQVDKNLEISVDLATLDQNALETFQLSVAYTFLDGRLRVSRDGGFTDNTGQAGAAAIIGDWQAEYLLTEDGVYRVRIFNRNNFNTFTSLSLSRNVATYGVAISQNISFNSLSELFQKITRRKKNQSSLVEDSDYFLRYNDGQDWQQIDLTPVENKLDSTYNLPIQYRPIPKR